MEAFLRSKGVQLDAGHLAALQTLFHELYLERILVPGTGDRTIGGGAMSWPLYRLTEYGERALEAAGYVPHDPEGYLARIKADIPEIDEVILKYVEEGLSCFRSDFLLAAPVMVGCAAEKALLLLVEAFGTAISDSGARAKYEKDTRSGGIAAKFAALWKRLEPASPRLPKNLCDDLKVVLERTFDLIRSTRNDAGHPTGATIDRETVRANFILFPGYCRRVYGLIHYFQKNPVP